MMKNVMMGFGDIMKTDWDWAEDDDGGRVEEGRAAWTFVYNG